MKYDNIVKGKFIARPNRFIAHIEINGKIEVCHVKNTGRCKELLIPSVIVFVQENDNAKRKTKFSLISVIKENRIINMDSQVPNKIVYEWISNGNLLNDIVVMLQFFYWFDFCNGFCFSSYIFDDRFSI